ncbi:MAG: TerD family protein, partial [Sphingobium limneticum]
MIQLSPGEKRPIQELTSNRQIDIVVNHTPADIDIAAFGLNAQRQIEDDRYTVLFSNARSPEGAISLSQSQGATTVSVDLDRVPSRVDRITVTATHDSASLSSASTLHAVIADCATLDAKPHLGDEKVVMLLDLYRHSGQWRLGAVIQGFAGGMAALITHFGGEVADEAPAPAPAQSPTASPAPSAPISLAKVDLRKRQVGVSLKKLGIEHEQAEVLFVIDGSGSMARLYSNGTVQETVERIAPVA